MPKHTLDFKPDEVGDSTYGFKCHGDWTSSCHFYPDCECESWGDHHEHPKVPHDHCWMQDWFDNNGVDYSGGDGVERGYGGEPEFARSGEISTDFQGDYISWDWK